MSYVPFRRYRKIWDSEENAYHYVPRLGRLQDPVMWRGYASLPIHKRLLIWFGSNLGITCDRLASLVPTFHAGLCQGRFISSFRHAEKLPEPTAKSLLLTLKELLGESADGDLGKADLGVVDHIARGDDLPGPKGGNPVCHQKDVGQATYPSRANPFRGIEKCVSVDPKIGYLPVSSFPPTSTRSTDSNRNPKNNPPSTNS